MTAQEIFNRAIICMGENDDNTGATMTGDTMEYKVRAVAILNILANEAYPYSDTFEPEQNKRSVLPPIANLSDEVQMDDYICGTVLPYGLAAELMKTEDAATANYCSQRYQELLEKARRLPSESSSVVDLYGMASEYNEFSRW